jgi:hypothetical protein
MSSILSPFDTLRDSGLPRKPLPHQNTARMTQISGTAIAYYPGPSMG